VIAAQANRPRPSVHHAADRFLDIRKRIRCQTGVASILKHALPA
jgi:hypothetical protein